MSGFLQDLRYGARTLIRSRGYTIVAVLTLALGISVNTTIFSFTKPFLFPPLPFDDPERIVFCWTANPSHGWNKNLASMPEYDEWRREITAFDEMSAHYVAVHTMLVGTQPVRVMAHHATANHLSMLGVRPQRGRLFLSGEQGPGAPRIAVVSHLFAQRRFGDAENAIGQQVLLDSTAYTVVGVAPPNFWFPSISDMWLPLDEDLARGSRNRRQLVVLGRLAPGVSPDQARAQMKTVAARLERAYPDSNEGWTVRAVTAGEEILNDNTGVMLVLLALAVGFVLLIACINVSNLTLARAQVRSREIAVRTALGATRGRVIRQLLVDSLLVAIAGGSLGLFLGYLGLELLIKMNVDQAPLLQLFGLDAWAAAFTAALSLLSVIIFGLLPAVGAARTDVASAFKDGRGAGGTTRGNVARSLVVAEIALTLPLLILAGLSIRSLIAMRALDRGYDMQHLLIGRVDLPSQSYPHGPQIAAFYSQLTERGRVIPGMRAIAVSSTLPSFGGRGSDTTAIAVEGRPDAAPGDRPWIVYGIVSPGYLKTMSIPLVQGRDLNDADVEGAPFVGIVNAAAVRRYWPNGDAIGRHLKMGDASSPNPWITIVGVAGDTTESRKAPPMPQLYLPLAQHPMSEMWIMARAADDPLSLAGGVRQVVRQIDASLQVHDIRSLEQYLAFRRGPTELYVSVLTVFGIAALILAIVGVYGVLAYTVSRRTQEIGVRMALGATRSDVLFMVIGQGLRLAGIGLVIGLGAGLLLGKTLSSRIFGVGVSGADPLTFGAVGGVLLLFALIACWIPAHRATRVEPVRALRYE